MPYSELDIDVSASEYHIDKAKDHHFEQCHVRLKSVTKFFVQFQMVPDHFFFISRYVYTDRVDFCGSLLMIFAYKEMPFPQARPEVCRNLEYFVASITKKIEFKIQKHSKIPKKGTKYRKKAQNTEKEHKIPKKGTKYRERAQNTEKRHKIPKKGTKYRKRAQNSEKTHKIPKKGTKYRKRAQNTEKEHKIPKKGTKYQRKAQNTEKGHKIAKKRTKYRKKAQNIEKGHKIAKKGTKYRKRAQNIEKRHKIPKNCEFQVQKVVWGRKVGPMNTTVTVACFYFAVGNMASLRCTNWLAAVWVGQWRDCSSIRTAFWRMSSVSSNWDPRPLRDTFWSLLNYFACVFLL